MGDSVVTRPANNTEIPTTSSYWFNQKVYAVAKMLCFNQKSDTSVVLKLLGAKRGFWLVRGLAFVKTDD